MNINLSKTLFGTALAAACACAITSPAQAGTLSGWSYAWDSFKDGTGTLNQNGGVGGHGVGITSNYEIFGLAYVEDIANDRVIFALNSNINLNGWNDNGAKDKNIGWGDFFLNFNPNKSFQQVQGTSDLLAIRFAGQNDSGVDSLSNGGNQVTVTETVMKLQNKRVTEQVPVLNANGTQRMRNGRPVYRTVTKTIQVEVPTTVQKTLVNGFTGETGIYSGVTAKNVTGTNNGWSSYSEYNNYVTSNKGTVELIDGMSLTDSQNYLGSHGYSVIDSYEQKVGDITLLDAAQLSALGLSFTNQASKDGLGSTLGTQTFGFSFARSLLPGGELNWMAHIMAECSNDTIGMDGVFADNTPPEPEDVPEPTALLGLTLGAAAFASSKRRPKMA